MDSQVICICGSHLLLLLLFCFFLLYWLLSLCAADLLLLFCQLLASLLHLLLTLCSTVPFSLCWVFYWSFIWLSTCFPTIKRQFTSSGHLYQIICSIMYLPACLNVFKCFTMKTKAEFTSAMCLQIGALSHANALSGLLFCSSKLYILPRCCHSLIADWKM